MSGEAGPCRDQRVRITVDPHERRLTRGLEDAGGVSAPAHGCIDDDSPMLQRRNEELRNFVCENRLVFHWMLVAYIPIAPAPGSRSQPSRGTRPPRTR